ncbi:hypothetical protein Leryth_007447 [Lithospermum erythrorhizon]|nr:hypothetical protein Leryth_007447 [Lithospermum erythrorhizon]
MESLTISNHIDLESGQGSDCVCRSSGEKGGSSSLSDDSDGHSSSEELDHSGPEIVGVAEKGRESSNPECSVDLDLEVGEEKDKSHYLVKSDMDCRICHLALDDSNQESGFPIELGCRCKNDLAAAHKQCAEAWFKIKGNRTCEICGSVARNVSAPNETQLLIRMKKRHFASIPAPPGEAGYR